MISCSVGLASTNMDKPAKTKRVCSNNKQREANKMWVKPVRSTTSFHDSHVVKKMHLGRTQAEMITMNGLGPNILNDLSLTKGKPEYFSPNTDASNKGNRKFPVCVRYFSESDVVQCKLLDFYKDSDETSSFDEPSGKG